MTIIAALSQNYVIGKEGKLPWHLPEDLKLFKKLTTGSNVLFGRKTFESVGPLKDRTIYVLTTNKNYKPEGAIPVTDISQLPEEIFIAGGEKVYRTFLPLADRLVLTLVKSLAEGDAFFPQFGEDFELKYVMVDTPEFSTCVFERNKSYERDYFRSY